jgi:DNA-binding transcriptional ArsR family regulator
MCLYVCMSGNARTDADDAAFRALASPSRRRILTLVRDEPLSVTAVATALGVSQPAASQHLGVLRDAGLVRVEVDGRRRLYGADHAAIASVRNFFDDYWSSALDRLGSAAERAAARRETAE